jgi:hypothetical protein
MWTRSYASRISSIRPSPRESAGPSPIVRSQTSATSLGLWLTILTARP